MLLLLLALGVVVDGEEGGEGEVGALEEERAQFVGYVVADVAGHLAIAHVDLHELEELAGLFLEQFAAGFDERLVDGVAAPGEHVAAIATPHRRGGRARRRGGRAALAARYEREEVVVVRAVLVVRVGVVALVAVVVLVVVGLVVVG